MWMDFTQWNKVISTYLIEVRGVSDRVIIEWRVVEVRRGLVLGGHGVPDPPGVVPEQPVELPEAPAGLRSGHLLQI